MILCDVSLFRWKSMFKVWIVAPRIPRWSVVMWKAVLRSKFRHSNLRLYIFNYVKFLVNMCDFGSPISSYILSWILLLIKIVPIDYLVYATLKDALISLLRWSCACHNCLFYPLNFLRISSHQSSVLIMCMLQSLVLCNYLPKHVLVSFLCML